MGAIKTKPLAGMAVLLMVASLFFHLFRREATRVRVARSAVLQLQAKLGEEHISIRRIQEGIANRESRRVALQTELAALRRSEASREFPVERRENVPPVTRAEQVVEWLKQDRETQTKPSWQLSELTRLRRQLVTSYGALYRELNLTPEKIAQFEESAARRYEKQMDLRAVIQSHAVDSRDPAILKMFTTFESDYQAAQKESLGDADYRRFQDYERRAPVREMVASLAGAAVTSGISFPREKTEELIDVMVKTDPNYVAGGRAAPIGINWQPVDEHAKAILSEEQFNLFSRVDPTAGNGRTWSRLNRAMNDAIRADESAR